MTQQASIHYDLTNNAISDIEYKLLSRLRISWFSRFIRWSGILLVITPIILGTVLSPMYSDDWSFLRDMRFLTEILMLHFFFMTVWFLFQIIQVSSHVINREKQPLVGDLIKLTGISSRRYVIGKWFAIMRYLRRDAIFYIVVRIGLMTWGASYNAIYRRQYSVSESDTLGLSSFQLPWEQFIFFVILAIIFVVLEIAMTSALAIVINLKFRRNRNYNDVAFIARLGLPLLITGVLGGLLLITGNMRIEGEEFNQGQVRYEIITVNQEIVSGAGYAIFNFVDNGNVAPISIMANDLSSLYYDISVNTVYILAQFVSVAIYFCIILISIRDGSRTARRRGWSNHNEIVVPTHFKKGKHKVKSAPESQEFIPSHAPSVAVRIPHEHSASNIFALANAQDYQAEVMSYRKLQRRLSLRLSKDGLPIYARFHGVHYHALPNQWRGGNVIIASAEQTETWRKKMHIPYHANSFLFIVTGTPGKIYAKSVELTESLSD